MTSGNGSLVHPIGGIYGKLSTYDTVSEEYIKEQLMPFSKDDHTDFFNDLREEGFHIFSRENAKFEGFYPNKFPDYPELDISKIQIDDRVTIRAFFFRNQSSSSPIDSGCIDLEVEFIDPETQLVTANILTELPTHFALSAGTSIELSLDEILQINNR